MYERFIYLQRRFRAMAPGFVRKIYRVVSTMRNHHASSQSLPEELVKNCRFCASRYTLLNHLPKNGIGCEVGTYKGDFARKLLNRCQPRELHLIDIDYTYFNDEGLQEQRIIRHTGHSVEQLSKFQDTYFNWVYIDADHSYKGVIADANASAPKLKPGGYIVFNDFAHIDPNLGRYGVHRAATDFALENGWPLVLFAFNGAARYDAGFQKPLNAD